MPPPPPPGIGGSLICSTSCAPFRRFTTQPGGWERASFGFIQMCFLSQGLLLEARAASSGSLHTPSARQLSPSKMWISGCRFPKLTTPHTQAALHCPQGQVLAPWQGSKRSWASQRALPDLLAAYPPPPATQICSPSCSAHVAFCLDSPSSDQHSSLNLQDEAQASPLPGSPPGPTVLPSAPDTPHCPCPQADGVLPCVLPEGCMLWTLEPCN